MLCSTLFKELACTVVGATVVVGAGVPAAAACVLGSTTIGCTTLPVPAVVAGISVAALLVAAPVVAGAELDWAATLASAATARAVMKRMVVDRLFVILVVGSVFMMSVLLVECVTDQCVALVGGLLLYGCACMAWHGMVEFKHTNHCIHSHTQVDLNCTRASYRVDGGSNNAAVIYADILCVLAAAFKGAHEFWVVEVAWLNSALSISSGGRHSDIHFWGCSSHGRAFRSHFNHEIREGKGIDTLHLHTTICCFFLLLSWHNTLMLVMCELPSD